VEDSYSSLFLIYYYIKKDNSIINKKGIGIKLMETVIEHIEGEYFICRRQDGVIINIPIKFLKEVKVGDVILLPDTRKRC
jgi:hypothetical protein